MLNLDLCMARMQRTVFCRFTILPTLPCAHKLVLWWLVWWLFQWMKADLLHCISGLYSGAAFSYCMINLCSELLRLEVLMPHFLPRHCMNHCRLGKMHRTFLSCMLTFRPQRNHQKKMPWVIFLSVSSIHSFKNSLFSVCFMYDWFEVGNVEIFLYI